MTMIGLSCSIFSERGELMIHGLQRIGPVVSMNLFFAPRFVSLLIGNVPDALSAKGRIIFRVQMMIHYLDILLYYYRLKTGNY